MRLAPLAVVLLAGAALAGGAASSQKAVEALVRKHVASLAALADDAKLGLAKDPLVVGIDAPDGFPGGLASKLHMSGPDITHTVKSVAVGVDDAKGVAWVQAPFHYKIEPRMSPESGEGNLWLISEGDMRFGALVVRDGTTWKLAAVDYSSVVSDADLVKDPRADKPQVVAPADDVAKVVAGWFKDGLAGHGATGTVIASGTSPSEYAVGAAATKLVAKWDKLGLVVEHAEGRMFGDSYAVVTATVDLPVKGSWVAMGLFAIVRRDGSDWRWLSLQYSR